MAVSLSEQRTLLLRSGNMCAFPDCHVRLTNHTPAGLLVVGEVAHITAGSAGGPRVDTRLTAAQRDRADNLILLCMIHHKLIDSQPSVFTAAVLLDMKFQHELWVEQRLSRHDLAPPKGRWHNVIHPLSDSHTTEIGFAERTFSPLGLLPPENTGALVQSRFMWQAALATIDALKLLERNTFSDPEHLGDRSATIICELYGDWLVQQDNTIEIVSCRHVEPARGPIANPRRLLDHGLVSLFKDWSTVQGSVRCRLVTNAHIAQPLQIALAEVGREDSLDGPPSKAFNDLVHEFTTQLTRSSLEAKTGTAEQVRAQVLRFLSVLTVESGVPDRKSIDAVGIRAYLDPMLRKLNLDPASAEMVWSALVVHLLGAMTGSRRVTPEDLIRTIRQTAPAATRLVPESVATDPAQRVLAHLTVYAASMTSTAGVWSELTEETIRTAIVASINAWDLGVATAETFNGRGKTDILVRLSDGATLIIELKYWSGRKDFAKALQQLLSYTAWRDKGIVIMPLITLQAVTSAIQEAHAEIQALPNCVPPVPVFVTERMDYTLTALGDPLQVIDLCLLPVPLTTSGRPRPGRPVRKKT